MTYPGSSEILENDWERRGEEERGGERRGDERREEKRGERRGEGRGEERRGEERRVNLLFSCISFVVVIKHHEMPSVNIALACL